MSSLRAEILFNFISRDTECVNVVELNLSGWMASHVPLLWTTANVASSTVLASPVGDLHKMEAEISLDQEAYFFHKYSYLCRGVCGLGWGRGSYSGFFTAVSNNFKSVVTLHK